MAPFTGSGWTLATSLGSQNVLQEAIMVAWQDSNR